MFAIKKFPPKSDWEFYVKAIGIRSLKFFVIGNVVAIVLYYVFLGDLIWGAEGSGSRTEIRYRQKAPYLFVLSPFFFYFVQMSHIRKILAKKDKE